MPGRLSAESSATQTAAGFKNTTLILHAVASLAAVTFLFVVARRNYLFFHTSIESASVLVSILICVLAANTFKYSASNFHLFLGIGYLFVGLTDFLHATTYYGMGIFPEFGRNTPTQLWIVSRCLEALTLLGATVLARRPFRRRLVLLVYAGVTSSLVASIMYFRVFPACFVDGQGLTRFKVVSEYVIALVMIGTLRLMYLRRDQVGSPYRTMLAPVSAGVLAELCFTLYTDVYGFMNFLGHLLVLAARYLTYRGVVARGLQAPYESIFAELKASAISDPLTGLWNRQGFLELAGQRLEAALAKGGTLGLLFLDLDNFKQINDQHGHAVGDRVLREFADLLRQSIRKEDIVCRWGGDEFAVLVSDPGPTELDAIAGRIKAALADWAKGDAVAGQVDTSIGTALCRPTAPNDLDRLLAQADREMYRVKLGRKEEPNPSLAPGA